jgi:hypothetical protein
MASLPGGAEASAVIAEYLDSLLDLGDLTVRDVRKHVEKSLGCKIQGKKEKKRFSKLVRAQLSRESDSVDGGTEDDGLLWLPPALGTFLGEEKMAADEVSH